VSVKRNGVAGVIVNWVAGNEKLMSGIKGRSRRTTTTTTTTDFKSGSSSSSSAKVAASSS
jgi:hypothetical protein